MRNWKLLTKQQERELLLRWLTDVGASQHMLQELQDYLLHQLEELDNEPVQET